MGLDVQGVMVLEYLLEMTLVWFLQHKPTIPKVKIKNYNTNWGRAGGRYPSRFWNESKSPTAFNEGKFCLSSLSSLVSTAIPKLRPSRLLASAVLWSLSSFMKVIWFKISVWCGGCRCSAPGTGPNSVFLIILLFFRQDGAISRHLNPHVSSNSASKASMSGSSAQYLLNGFEWMKCISCAIRTKTYFALTQRKAATVKKNSQTKKTGQN